MRKRGYRKARYSYGLVGLYENGITSLMVPMAREEAAKLLRRWQHEARPRPWNAWRGSREWVLPIRYSGRLEAGRCYREVYVYVVRG